MINPLVVAGVGCVGPTMPTAERGMDTNYAAGLVVASSVKNEKEGTGETRPKGARERRLVSVYVVVLQKIKK